MKDYFSIRWQDGVVRILDQRLLPGEVVYRDYTRSSDVAAAIREMVIRGAPAIGVAAGYGLALAALNSKAATHRKFMTDMNAAASELEKSRPTAVNLFKSIERIKNALNRALKMEINQLKELVLAEAGRIAEEDIQMDLRMAQNGQLFIPDRANLIHHCNTGALATAGIGTAMGVIRVAHEKGKKIHVFIDETRPRLQGARLTAWELKQLGIPHTLIVDGASGYIMQHNRIDACLVGCDRIAANGDVANKIGTYNLAIVAHAHGVPFYPVGPTTTIDLSTSTGAEIPIEQRPKNEVTHFGDTLITPVDMDVANPAFDITPAKYITAIITDKGVVIPPYKKSLAELMQR